MLILNKIEYDNFIDACLKEKGLAVDIETESFDIKKTHAFELALDGVGLLGDSVKGYISADLLDDKFQKVLDTVPLIFHNAKFDMTVLEAYGFNFDKSNVHDTMILAWLLNENRNSFGLKKLAETVLKISKEKITVFDDVKKPSKESFGLFAFDYQPALEKWRQDLAKYCLDDCKYTYKLYSKFCKEACEEGLWSVYKRLEIPFMKTLKDMEKRGIMIDIEYLNKIGAEMEVDLIELQADVWKTAGEQFDINSPKQLGDILFKKMKYDLPAEYRTPTGEKSTNKAALDYLANDDKCVIAQKVLKYREIAKLHSTYVIGLLDKQKDGVIYASFLQHGTVTGRLSSSSPNLQNLPRRDDKYNIRKAFIPREGYKFIISDLSQIELRLLAHFSGDPYLMQAYKDGKDIHQETADVLGCERVVAKTVNFGIAYGRTAFGMAKGMNMPVHEAEKFIERYYSQFGGLKSFIDSVQAGVSEKKTNHSVQTILGRYRRFAQEWYAAKARNDWKMLSRIKRQAVNAVIQGSAADIIKLQMRNLNREMKKYDAHLLIQIHDEVIIECPADKCDAALKEVKNIMEHALELPSGVPIITQPEICDVWKK